MLAHGPTLSRKGAAAVHAAGNSPRAEVENPRARAWGAGLVSEGRAPASRRHSLVEANASPACSTHERLGRAVRERGGGALFGHGHLPELPVPQPSLPAGREEPGLPRLHLARPAGPGTSGPSRAAKVTRCWLPAGLPRNKRKPPPAVAAARPPTRLLTGAEGPVSLHGVCSSTLRETRAPGPCGGSLLPACHPDLGPPREQLVS